MNQRTRINPIKSNKWYQKSIHGLLSLSTRGRSSLVFGYFYTVQRVRTVSVLSEPSDQRVVSHNKNLSSWPSDGRDMKTSSAIRRGAWGATQGGRCVRRRVRSTNTRTVGRRCVCGSGESARPTGRTSTHTRATHSDTAFRRCEFSCVPWDESSCCTSWRSRGSGRRGPSSTVGVPTFVWTASAAA